MQVLSKSKKNLKLNKILVELKMINLSNKKETKKMTRLEQFYKTENSKNLNLFLKKKEMMTKSP